MTQAAQRLKTFGADLQFVQMDEPLWYGHRFKGVGKWKACKATIDELAIDAASKLKHLFELFPLVNVVDTEPFGGGISGELWASDIIEWRKKFLIHSGKPINYFDADVVWQMPNAVREFADALPLLRSQQLNLGIIYNGKPDASSDCEWVDQARRKIESIEKATDFRFSRILIETWTDFPRRILPESNPCTLTGLIKSYENRRLTSQTSGPTQER
jgi:hypothetical protein